MNVFNRIVVTLLLLVLIPLVTVVFIVPNEFVQVLLDWLQPLEDQLADSMSASRLLIGGVLALLIDAILVFLIYLEVRRRPTGTVPVPKVEGGQAQIAVDSVVDRLKYHIDRLSGVLDVDPQVSSHRRGVEIVLNVDLSTNVNMREKVEEISALARLVVEDEIGLKIHGKPRINLRTVALPGPLGEAGPEGLEAYEELDTFDEPAVAVLEQEKAEEPAAWEEAEIVPPEEIEEEADQKA
jgi:hypothetical protein